MRTHLHLVRFVLTVLCAIACAGLAAWTVIEHRRDTGFGDGTFVAAMVYLALHNVFDALKAWSVWRSPNA